MEKVFQGLQFKFFYLGEVIDMYNKDNYQKRPTDVSYFDQLPFSRVLGTPNTQNVQRHSYRGFINQVSTKDYNYDLLGQEKPGNFSFLSLESGSKVSENIMYFGTNKDTYDNGKTFKRAIYQALIRVEISLSKEKV